MLVINILASRVSKAVKKEIMLVAVHISAAVIP